MSETEIICETMDRGAVTTLDRPEALNSLIFTMVREMTRALGGSPFAAKTRETILAISPTSLAVALKQMQLGAKLDVAEPLRMDLRSVARIAQGREIYKGVRATMIDSDNAPRRMPRRMPGTLDAVGPAGIDACFAPLVDGELESPSRVRAP